MEKRNTLFLDPKQHLQDTCQKPRGSDDHDLHRNLPSTCAYRHSRSLSAEMPQERGAHQQEKLQRSEFPPPTQTRKGPENDTTHHAYPSLPSLPRLTGIPRAAHDGTAQSMCAAMSHAELSHKTVFHRFLCSVISIFILSRFVQIRAVKRGVPRTFRSTPPGVIFSRPALPGHSRPSDP